MLCGVRTAAHAAQCGNVPREQNFCTAKIPRTPEHQVDSASALEEELACQA